MIKKIYFLPKQYIFHKQWRICIIFNLVQFCGLSYKKHIHRTNRENISSENPLPHLGKYTSILSGMKKTPQLSFFLVLTSKIISSALYWKNVSSPFLASNGTRDITLKSLRYGTCFSLSPSRNFCWSGHEKLVQVSPFPRLGVIYLWHIAISLLYDNVFPSNNVLLVATVCIHIVVKSVVSWKKCCCLKI